jgi:transposase
MFLTPEDPRQLYFTSRAEEVYNEKLVRTIDEVVNQLDLKPLYACWSEKGRGIFDAAMMLKIIFFAYSQGERFGRRIARNINYDIRYRYFAGSLRPSYRTINRFRNVNIDLMAYYFIQIVSICNEMGLLDTSMVAIDGTKIKASASKRRTYSKKDRDKLIKKFKEFLTEDSEDAGIDGDDIEDEEEQVVEVEVISDKTLKDRVRQAKQRLDAGESEVNLTDVDSKLMKDSKGVIEPSFNGQIMTDKNQLIIAAYLFTNVSDAALLQPMIKQGKANVTSQIGIILVDGGYFSNYNLKYIVKEGLNVYMPTGSGNPEPETKFSRYDFIYDDKTDSYICPAGERLTYKYSRKKNGTRSKVYRCSARKCRLCKLKSQCTTARSRELNISEVWEHERAMNEKLSTKEGRKISGRRKVLVEPVFGNMKFNMGFTRFVLRGLTKVKGEFMLMCIAYNLKKMSKYWGNLTASTNAYAVLLNQICLIIMLILTIWRKFKTICTTPYSKIEYAC